MRTFDAAVIGAGIHGLTAAYHLHRLGCRDIVIFEQFTIGNDRGSSHGDYCKLKNMTVLENTRVDAFEIHDDRIEFRTSRGAFESGKCIITAGPWTGKLLSVPRCPLVPARHVTAGASDDPDVECPPGAAAIDDLLQFLRAQLAVPVEHCIHAETCFYTNTPTEDYVIDVHPNDRRVAIGAGFSGHGFKLAPVTGRILAELVMHGRSTVEEFNNHRGMFSLNVNPPR
ncbi:MAG: FAD-dependent oxidoreductase [Planctomycetes bacterium]|nr:FAD-dependent oxidoreductase [Planctomycetota bacterium]